MSTKKIFVGVGALFLLIVFISISGIGIITLPLFVIIATIFAIYKLSRGQMKILPRIVLIILVLIGVIFTTYFFYNFISDGGINIH